MTNSGPKIVQATTEQEHPTRVLVVDDEPELAELVATALRIAGCRATLASDGATALDRMRRQPFEAVILDYMLPDADGDQVLRRMRAIDPSIPILFLTARGEVRDRVAGLQAGADDYLTKPFNLEELVARLQAVLRRTQSTNDSNVLTFADLRMDLDSHTVNRGNESIDLTPTEFELLRFLLVNARTVVSKQQILQQVWGFDFDGRTSVVELYIGYLRRKIDRGHPALIHTVRGVGYVIREAAEMKPARRG